MYTILNFSATGNSRYISELVSEELGIASDNILELEKTDPALLGKPQQLILIFPVHGFNAPETVIQFIKKIPQNSQCSTSIIAVGCIDNWINKGASLRLKKHLKKKQHTVILDEIVAMPLTFVMKFPEDYSGILLKRARVKARVLSKAILKGGSPSAHIPFKSRLLSFIGRGEKHAARLFGLELHASKRCTSCSVCRNNCPVKNIRKKRNGRPRFGFKCMMCMKCIYNCPEKAISPWISRFIPLKDGYSLKDYLK